MQIDEIPIARLVNSYLPKKPIRWSCDPSLFPIPLAKTAGNRRAEKYDSIVDLPNRAAHTVSAGLFDQITKAIRD
jgi:hypothetical protein